MVVSTVIVKITSKRWKELVIERPVVVVNTLVILFGSNIWWGSDLSIRGLIFIL
jgi:hypothetical protein